VKHDEDRERERERERDQEIERVCVSFRRVADDKLQQQALRDAGSYT